MQGPPGHEKAFGFGSKDGKPLMRSEMNNICFMFSKAPSGCRCKRTWGPDWNEGDPLSRGGDDGDRGKTGLGVDGSGPS